VFKATQKRVHLLKEWGHNSRCKNWRVGGVKGGEHYSFPHGGNTKVKEKGQLERKGGGGLESPIKKKGWGVKKIKEGGSQNGVTR